MMRYVQRFVVSVFLFSMAGPVLAADCLDAPTEECLADLSVGAINGIGDATKRIAAYLALGNAQVASDRPVFARQTFGLAAMTVDMVPDQIDQDDLRSQIVSAQARAGFTGDATATLALIHDQYSREYALADIVYATAAAGDMTGALALGNQITGTDARDLARAWLVVAMAEAGSFKDALDLARRIGSGDWRDGALVRLAKMVAEAGKFEPALLIAHQIVDELDRNDVYGNIAAEQVRLGQTTEAMTMIDTYTSVDGRSFAFSLVAVAQAENGDLDAAFDSLDQIEGPLDLYYAYVDIGRATAERGDLETASAFFGFAHDFPMDFFVTEQQPAARYTLASGQAQAGLINAAFGTTGPIPDGFDRDRALGAIAAAQFKAGQADRGQSTLRMIKLPDALALGYHDVAVALFD